jgi:hypothetical protein
MPAPPVRGFSFTDWQVNNPTAPPPGDKLDSEFDRADQAITNTITWANTSLNNDGTLRAASVGSAQLVPGLFDSVADDAISEVQPLVDEATAASSSALASADAAATSATTAQTQADAASGRAGDAEDAAAVAQAAAGQAVTAANAAAVSENNAANSDNHATLAQNTCDDYADVCQAWAEHMPDPIPPNILAVMGVTGDHWSSRWWATRAQAAFGSLAELYLGVSDTPPTTTQTGQPIPTGAIYYNSTLQQPFVWDGQEWRPFYAPTKALTLGLTYAAVSNQTNFVLTAPDLAGNTYAISVTNPEPIEVLINGVRQVETQGALAGDFSLDPSTSTVVFTKGLLVGSLVQIDILAPASTLAPSSVTTEQLLDFDIDPATGNPGQIDGARTTFPLADATTRDLITIARATEILVLLDGVVQKPGNDYNVTSASGASSIVFGEAPVVGAQAWALWYAPEGVAARATPTVARAMAPAAAAEVAPCFCPVGMVVTSFLSPSRTLSQPGGENWRALDGSSIAGTRLAELLGTDFLPEQVNAYVRVN